MLIHRYRPRTSKIGAATETGSVGLPTLAAMEGNRLPFSEEIAQPPNSLGCGHCRIREKTLRFGTGISTSSVDA